MSLQNWLRDDVTVASSTEQNALQLLTTPGVNASAPHQLQWITLSGSDSVGVGRALLDAGWAPLAIATHGHYSTDKGVVPHVGPGALLSEQEDISRYFLDWYVEMIRRHGEVMAAYSAVNKARAERQSEFLERTEIAARNGPASMSRPKEDTAALITPCLLSSPKPVPSPRELPGSYLERALLQTKLRTHVLTTPPLSPAVLLPPLGEGAGGSGRSSLLARLTCDTILNASFTQVILLDVTFLERDPSDTVVPPAVRVKLELARRLGCGSEASLGTHLQQRAVLVLLDHVRHFHTITTLTPLFTSASRLVAVCAPGSGAEATVADIETANDTKGPVRTLRMDALSSDEARTMVVQSSNDILSSETAEELVRTLTRTNLLLTPLVLRLVVGCFADVKPGNRVAEQGCLDEVVQAVNHSETNSHHDVLSAILEYNLQSITKGRKGEIFTLYRQCHRMLVPDTAVAIDTVATLSGTTVANARRNLLVLVQRGLARPYVRTPGGFDGLFFESELRSVLTTLTSADHHDLVQNYREVSPPGWCIAPPDTDFYAYRFLWHHLRSAEHNYEADQHLYSLEWLQHQLQARVTDPIGTLPAFVTIRAQAQTIMEASGLTSLSPRVAAETLDVGDALVDRLPRSMQLGEGEEGGRVQVLGPRWAVPESGSDPDQIQVVFDLADIDLETVGAGLTAATMSSFLGVPVIKMDFVSKGIDVVVTCTVSIVSDQQQEGAVLVIFDRGLSSQVGTSVDDDVLWMRAEAAAVSQATGCSIYTCDGTRKPAAAAMSATDGTEETDADNESRSLFTEDKGRWSHLKWLHIVALSDESVMKLLNPDPDRDNPLDSLGATRFPCGLHLVSLSCSTSSACCKSVLSASKAKFVVGWDGQLSGHHETDSAASTRAVAAGFHLQLYSHLDAVEAEGDEGRYENAFKQANQQAQKAHGWVAQAKAHLFSASIISDNTHVRTFPSGYVERRTHAQTLRRLLLRSESTRKCIMLHDKAAAPARGGRGNSLHWGHGKTVLASAATNDIVVQMAYVGGVMWVSLPPSVTQQQVLNALALKVLGPDHQVQHTSPLLCKSLLETHFSSHAICVVVDAVDSVATANLIRALVRSPSLALIVARRNDHGDSEATLLRELSDVHHHDVGGLEPDEAVHVLQSRMSADAHLLEQLTIKQDAAVSLTELTDLNPWKLSAAISLAAELGHTSALGTLDWLATISRGGLTPAVVLDLLTAKTNNSTSVSNNNNTEHLMRFNVLRQAAVLPPGEAAVPASLLRSFAYMSGGVIEWSDESYAQILESLVATGVLEVTPGAGGTEASYNVRSSLQPLLRHWHATNPVASLISVEQTHRTMVHALTGLRARGKGWESAVLPPSGVAEQNATPSGCYCRKWLRYHLVRSSDVNHQAEASSIGTHPGWATSCLRSVYPLGSTTRTRLDEWYQANTETAKSGGGGQEGVVLVFDATSGSEAGADASVHWAQAEAMEVARVWTGNIRGVHIHAVSAPDQLREIFPVWSRKQQKQARRRKRSNYGEKVTHDLAEGVTWIHVIAPNLATMEPALQQLQELAAKQHDNGGESVSSLVLFLSIGGAGYRHDQGNADNVFRMLRVVAQGNGFGSVVCWETEALLLGKIAFASRFYSTLAAEMQDTSKMRTEAAADATETAVQSAFAAAKEGLAAIAPGVNVKLSDPVLQVQNDIKRLQRNQSAGTDLSTGTPWLLKRSALTNRVSLPTIDRSTALDGTGGWFQHKDTDLQQLLNLVVLKAEHNAIIVSSKPPDTMDDEGEVCFEG